jgi:hypothetical protein
MALRSVGNLNKTKGQNEKTTLFVLLNFLDIYKVDIVFASFCVLLISGYYYYITIQQVPSHDAAFYLLNARDWLTGQPLDEHYRPPLTSWIIAAIWFVTGAGQNGEDWRSVHWVQAAFTIGAGILIYLLLRKYKGGLFAFGVTALTMTHEALFLASGYIQPEGLALFFLVLTLYFLKTQKENYWFLAGITAGLTFASRYPIFLQAIVIFLAESMIVKKPKLAFRAILGTVPIVMTVIVAVYLRAGIFQMALGKDTSVSLSLSPFYLVNSFEIWGFAFILVPVALMQKRTYANSFNYTFIAWFIISLMFWSASSDNHQFRFTSQFSPAVYFLSILAIENISKWNGVIGNNSYRLSTRKVIIRQYLGHTLKSCTGRILLFSSIGSVLIFFTFFSTLLININDLYPINQQIQRQSQEIQNNNKNDNNYFVYGIKITSPMPNQNLMTNSKKELIVSGTSSTPQITTTNINDNNEGGRNGCQVLVILNGIQPYQKAIPTGPNGINDYSTWEFKIIPSDHYQINEGINRITAKLSCTAATNNDTPEYVYDVKWYSVNIIGVS